MAVMADAERSPVESPNGRAEPQDAVSPPAPTGGRTGIAAVPPTGYDDYEKLNNELLGEEITLKVVHPKGGDALFFEIHMGQDVARAKNIVAEKLGVRYGDVTLFVEGKLMMDPLSLSDIAEVKETAAAGAPVEIEAKLREDAA